VATNGEDEEEAGDEAECKRDAEELGLSAGVVCVVCVVSAWGVCVWER
jgi:hypothetical protein